MDQLNSVESESEYTSVSDIDIVITEPIVTVTEPIITVTEPIVNVTEPIVNANENVLLKSLIVLIANSTIGESLGTITITLTPDEINILKQIISVSPDRLNDINNCVLEIIKDGKMDVMDIPPLIKIIEDIYVLSHQQITIKVPSLVNAIGSILKYLLQVILTNNNLSSPELIKSCDGLIDMVVVMIKLEPSLKTKTCFLNFKFC
jgi:hypothetical protein